MFASSIIKTIFEIKATEEKTNISTPMLYGSGKKSLSFGSLAASAPPKISVGVLTTYYSTGGSGVFKFGSSTGGSEFDTFPEINTEHFSG